MGLNLLSKLRLLGTRRPESESSFTSSVMTYAVDDLSLNEVRAHHAGDLAIMRAAMKELAQVDPKNPLLMPEVARTIYELGANCFRERGWNAVARLTADPRAVLTEQLIDFEGRRARLIDAVAASPIKVTSKRHLLFFQKHIVTWRGRPYPTERAALAAQRSEITRLRGSVLGDTLETRPSSLAPRGGQPRQRANDNAFA